MASKESKYLSILLICLIFVSGVTAASDSATSNYEFQQNQQCEPDREFIKNNSIYKCNSEGTNSYLLVECSSDEEADRNSQEEVICADKNDEEKSGPQVSPLVILAANGVPARELMILSIIGVIAGSGYWFGKKRNSE